MYEQSHSFDNLRCSSEVVISCIYLTDVNGLTWRQEIRTQLAGIPYFQTSFCGQVNTGPPPTTKVIKPIGEQARPQKQSNKLFEARAFHCTYTTFEAISS